LACADQLQKKGVIATVYEADHSRVGGRCKSARDTFPGQIAELGGEMNVDATKNGNTPQSKADESKTSPLEGVRSGFDLQNFRFLAW